MDFLQNEEQYLRVANYLMKVNQDKALNLPLSTMKPTPSELYVNTIFTAGGNVPLLTGNITQEVGITNFDGNKLEDKRYFVIDGVTIQYGEGTKATDKVFAVKYDKELPAVLLSSTLVIRQKNEIVLKLPVASIEMAKKSFEVYRKLGALALLEPNAPIEMFLETPMGSTIQVSSGDSSYIRVLLKGFETYLKR
ncbi:hypothetical protein [Capnocytophaga catalasegens]|uniref:Uncharacterized protein n=1 Tax=Capnocytophaga catalasegens TaxID=1004260 RepID=A0AAV5B0R9_9FLAO|nr:hypothetical protein [Capnocytophaga catalasegens]GIZ16215.1 hypothetical protein RCZ03_22150 [Capnocytophaga catalasegens]GJM51640.1 hypothetical protein RCZ15_26130 [Capnocytophaga catalasegens]GJM54330.1 hypothetical protein RCZ16_26460 [Capnocytophaga catalasegens]